MPLPGEVTWPAAVVGEGDLVAVGTRGGQLVLTHASGRPFATYAARDEVTAPGGLYRAARAFRRVGRHAAPGELSDGAEVWRHQARAELTGAPTLWADRVLAASRDGHLHALERPHRRTGLGLPRRRSGGRQSAGVGRCGAGLR